jgi:hypothetical protein
MRSRSIDDLLFANATATGSGSTGFSDGPQYVAARGPIRPGERLGEQQPPVGGRFDAHGARAGPYPAVVAQLGVGGPDAVVLTMPDKCAPDDPAARVDRLHDAFAFAELKPGLTRDGAGGRCRHRLEDAQVEIEWISTERLPQLVDEDTDRVGDRPRIAEVVEDATTSRVVSTDDEDPA